MIGFLLRFLLLLGVYAWWIEPSRLTVTQHRVEHPDRPLANPVRALLLTDWHLGRWTRRRGLRRKMRRLAREHRRQPFDLVLLGGDYVDTDPHCLPKLEPVLQALSELDVPRFAVLGNHDYSSFAGNPEPVIELLTAHGVQLLCNEAVSITVGTQRLLVVGLDDLQESKAYYNQNVYKTPDEYRLAALEMSWYAAFDAVEPETPRLLLSHNPDAVHLPGRSPHVVLAGHTHGGQMVFLDWISRPAHRWVHPHLPPGSIVTWAGRRQVNGRTLIVSRGMEGSALPLRLLRPPEAVVVTLR